MYRGESSAFEQLFLRHYHKVYRVLYNLLGNIDEVEDVLQETFLTLYRQPPQLTEQESVTPWLCRVALNKGYNLLRSQKRGQQRMKRVAVQDAEVVPDDILLQTEERQQVNTVLTHLSHRQSQILLLRYAGYSYSEIADILHVAPGSVGTLLARAERAFLKVYQDMALQQCDSQRLLRAYLDDALPAAQLAPLQQHLTTCARCSQVLIQLQNQKEQVSRHLFVQKPQQEVIQRMVHTLLTRAQQLRLSGKWQEVIQLEQEVQSTEDITPLEQAAFAVLAADAYLHIGDKDSAQHLLENFEQQQDQLPAEHPLRQEALALQNVLNSETPVGQLWQAEHSETIDKELRKLEASQLVLDSSASSLEQRCEAAFFLLTMYFIRGETTQAEHYLSLLEHDLKQLPPQHRLHKRVERIKEMQDQQTPAGMRMQIVLLMAQGKTDAAIQTAEKILRHPESTVVQRAIACNHIVIMLMNQNKLTEARVYLMELENEVQQAPDDKMLHTMLSSLQQALAKKSNPTPETPTRRLLRQGEQLIKEQAWTEVLTRISPILDSDEATENERFRTYYLLAAAHVGLHQTEEVQKLFARLQAECQDEQKIQGMRSTMQMLVGGMLPKTLD